MDRKRGLSSPNYAKSQLLHRTGCPSSWKQHLCDEAAFSVGVWLQTPRRAIFSSHAVDVPAASVLQVYGCMGRQVKAKASLCPPCTSAQHPTRRTLTKHTTKYKDIYARLRYDSSSHFSMWLRGQNIPANVPRRALCGGDKIFCSPRQHVLWTPCKWSSSAPTRAITPNGYLCDTGICTEMRSASIRAQLSGKQTRPLLKLTEALQETARGTVKC